MYNNYINSLKDTEPILFIAMPPTPNGGLHLGHVVGPFLKMDIMTRWKRQIGGKALFYSGVDSFDSYVILESFNQKKSAEKIIENYYDVIKSDLLKMDIELDQFVNPIKKNLFYRFQ